MRDTWQISSRTWISWTRVPLNTLSAIAIVSLAEGHDIYSCPTATPLLLPFFLVIFHLVPPPHPQSHQGDTSWDDDADDGVSVCLGSSQGMEPTTGGETTKIHSKFITFTTSSTKRAFGGHTRNKTIPFRWFSVGYFIFLVHCQGTIKQTSQGPSNIIVLLRDEASSSSPPLLLLLLLIHLFPFWVSPSLRVVVWLLFLTATPSSLCQRTIHRHLGGQSYYNCICECHEISGRLLCRG